jgi:hypothetical protein
MRLPNILVIIFTQEELCIPEDDSTSIRVNSICTPRTGIPRCVGIQQPDPAMEDKSICTRNRPSEGFNCRAV